MSDACEAACRAVARLLAAGLELDAESLETVLAALGEADPARALERLAADPEACEHAPLVALLFSPGASAMHALEPALARANLDASGAAALTEAVASRLGGKRLPVLLPGGFPAAAFPASGDDLRGYVRRLRPEATLPAELRAVLARRLPPESAAELAVLLRHSRLAWTPERVFFLAALLDRANAATDDLPGLTAWAAGFLDLAANPSSPFDPREALLLRRQALTTQLRQAEAAELALAQGSYETRLSQGLRLGHVHGPDVRRELALLDRACRLVLGVPGASLEQGGVVVRDLGAAMDMEELLKLLP
jgi:hypothetical protein